MKDKILSFIYSKKKNKFLSLRTNPHPDHGNKDEWYTVTGGVEKGESEEKAIIREVKEETNLDVREVYPLNQGCEYNWKGEKCRELYYIAFVEDGNVKLNEENIDYKWLNIDKFSEILAWINDKGELKSFLERGIAKNITFPWKIIELFNSKTGLDREFTKDNEKVILIWNKNPNFSKLSPVKQAYGVCFDKKGRILIINTTGNWSLPGGTIEKGETAEQTLRRELIEEGDIEVGGITPIGYNRVESYKDDKIVETFYQLRYFARISKVMKQTIDPARGKIPKRKFINPKNFLYYCNWGRAGEEMMKRALEIYKERKI